MERYAKLRKARSLDDSSLMVATTSSLAAGIAASILYLVGTVTQLRQLSRAVPIGMKSLSALAIPAVALHGLVTYWAINTPTGFDLGIYSTASLVSFVMALFVLITALKLPVQNLLVLVFPIGALGVVGALFGESSFMPRDSLPAALVFHVLMSMIAYSILFMAACQSIVLAVQEHFLRARHGIALIRLLPPLETMETLLFSLLWTGLVALSVGIASGFAFLNNMFAQHVAHHTVLSSLSWVVYATLLAGHKLFGWRGTTAVRWTLIAFALLLLGYFGSKFVLEILLQG
jgi:ABC-type uncharacterized transport system permease subunit